MAISKQLQTGTYETLQNKYVWASTDIVQAKLQSAFWQFHCQLSSGRDASDQSL